MPTAAETGNKILSSLFRSPAQGFCVDLTARSGRADCDVCADGGGGGGRKKKIDAALRDVDQESKDARQWSYPTRARRRRRTPIAPSPIRLQAIGSGTTV